MEALSVPMYHLLKSVQGNSNQGNVALFGESAGKKCACNALFSVCWSVVGKVSIWRTYDFDSILIESDKIYKFLNKYDFLSVNELPRSIKSYNCNTDINVEFFMKEWLPRGNAFYKIL